MPDAKVIVDVESDISDVLNSFLKLNKETQKVAGSVRDIATAVNEVKKESYDLKSNFDITETFEIGNILEELEELRKKVVEIPKEFKKYELPYESMPYYESGIEPDEVQDIEWVGDYVGNINEAFTTEMQDFVKGIKSDLLTDVEHWMTPVDPFAKPPKEVTGTSMGFSQTDTKLMREDDKQRKKDQASVMGKGGGKTGGAMKLLGKAGGPLGMILGSVLGFVQQAAKQSVVLQNIMNLVLLPLTTLLNFVLLPVLKWLVPFISNSLKWILENKDGLEMVGSFITKIFEAIFFLATTPWQDLFTLFESFTKLSSLTFGALSDFVGEVWSALGTLWEDIVGSIISFIKGEITFEELITNIVTAISNFFSGIKTAINNLISTVAIGIGTFITEIITKILDRIEPIISWMNDVWKALTSGDPLGALGNMLTSWLNPNKGDTTTNNTSYNYIYDGQSGTYKDGSGQIIDLNAISLKGGV